MYWLSIDAVVGGLAEPAGRGLVVGLAVDALGIEDREIVHGLGVAGFGGGHIEPARGIEVLANAHALFVEPAEAELRRHEALAGGALEPGRGLGKILRYAAAVGKPRRDLELGGGIAVGGGGAQAAAADAGGQPVGGCWCAWRVPGLSGATAPARLRHDGGLRDRLVERTGGPGFVGGGRRDRQLQSTPKAFGEIEKPGGSALDWRSDAGAGAVTVGGSATGVSSCRSARRSRRAGPEPRGHEMQRAEDEQDDAGADHQLADLPPSLPISEDLSALPPVGAVAAFLLRRRRLDHGSLRGAARGGDEIRLAGRDRE